jgi:hyaluronan synthase
MPMLTFLLSSAAFAAGGRVTLFMMLFALVTIIWIIRILISRNYNPVDNDHTETTAVIIPVVDESTDLFKSVLTSISFQNPTEIIVVINGQRNEALEEACDEVRIRWKWIETASKRHAVVTGLTETNSKLVILVDSDTIWTSGTLEEIVKPFGNPRVGGVTSKQAIINPRRNLLTRWANWLEAIRVHYSLPTMSTLGAVGCLPGRTIAFRREVLEARIDDFLNDEFLGVHLEISDDRALTNYALQDGWQTVYQSTSLVYTDAPTDLSTLVKQQIRWARGSQYNTLRMAPWMIKNSPLLAFFYIADILVPVMTVAIYFGWFVRWVFDIRTLSMYDILFAFIANNWFAVPLIVAVAIVLSWLWAAVRFKRVLDADPSYLPLIPVFILLNTLILIPVRVYGLMVCAKNDNWGTRRGAYSASRLEPMATNIPALLSLGTFVFFTALEIYL